MKRLIGRFFPSPIFEDDGNKSRQANLLSLAIFLSVLITIFIVIGNIARKKTSNLVFIVGGVVLLVLLLLRFLLSKGKIKTTGILFIVLGFIIGTIAVVSSGTVRTTLLFMLVIVIAGLLFESKGLILSTLSSSIIVLFMVFAENAGLLPSPDYSVNITQWVIYSTIFGLIGALIFYSNQITRKILKRTITETKERMQVAEALKASEARYSSMIKELFIGVAIHVDNKIVFANKALVNILERESTEEFIGKSILDFVYPKDRPMVMAAIQSGLSGETGPTFIQERLIKKDGSTVIVEASAIIIDYYGKPNVMVMINDISEQEKAKQLQSILYRISQTGNRAQTPEELYSAVYALIQEIIFVENFYIALYDHSTNNLKMVFVNDKIDPIPAIATKNGLTEYVYKNEETFMGTKEEIKTLQGRDKISLGGAEAALWLGIPLITQGKSIGVMAFQDYHDKNAFNEKEKEMLELISTPIASAISQQLADNEFHTYAQSNALLFQAAQELSETLSTVILYKNLYNIIKKLMDCNTFILSKYDAKEKMIHCDYIIHEGEEKDPQNLPPIPLEPEGKSTQSRVIYEGKALIINSLSEQIKNTDTAHYINNDGEISDYSNIPEDEATPNSLLAAPLKTKGDIVGVVQVMSYKNNAYTQEQLNFLQALSFQISLSLNNTRLFAQAQEEINLREQAEKELKDLNLELEKSVQERTAQLNQRIETVEKMNMGMTNMMQDLNHANALAKRKTQALEESNEELEAFTYSVSHDLRAPLRHIENFIKLMRAKEGKNLSEGAQHYTENIIRSTQRMRNLIEDLLTLSRTSRVDIHPVNTKPNIIIDSIRAQQFDEESKRQITWKIAPLPPTLADAGLMKILWENLIENALKYTRLQEEAIIEIGTLELENEKTFFIRDNGAGFPNEYRDKLFIAFERLHKSEDFEGSGIGLTIVKRIVERHGGKIWAESKENKGATFYFTLNIAETIEFSNNSQTSEAT
ncbi:MAG: GAF domain-containing protein [Chloroflexi bacterium]|nr:GAF domain-containing protein [Chloroflexota bacterium]